jgi:aldose 1-epimerase
LIPNGEFRDVNDTAFDFTKFKTVGKDVDADDEQLRFAGGYDHNFVLDLKEDDLCAITIGDKSGIVMKTYTNQNGIQFYGGNFLTLRMGKSGKLYDRRDAFCLEAQSFPNALNLSTFGSPIIRAGEVYRNQTAYRFSTVEGE